MPTVSSPPVIPPKMIPNNTTNPNKTRGLKIHSRITRAAKSSEDIHHAPHNHAIADQYSMVAIRAVYEVLCVFTPEKDTPPFSISRGGVTISYQPSAISHITHSDAASHSASRSSPPA